MNTMETRRTQNHISFHGDGAEPLKLDFGIPVDSLFESMPDSTEDPAEWSREHKRRYEQEGTALASLLNNHLPGGLFDALLGAMLSIKSSHLIVTCGSFHVHPRHCPVDPPSTASLDDAPPAS